MGNFWVVAQLHSVSNIFRAHRQEMGFQDFKLGHLRYVLQSLNRIKKSKHNCGSFISYVVASPIKTKKKLHVTANLVTIVRLLLSATRVLYIMHFCI